MFLTQMKYWIWIPFAIGMFASTGDWWFVPFFLCTQFFFVWFLDALLEMKVNGLLNYFEVFYFYTLLAGPICTFSWLFYSFYEKYPL